MYRDRDVRQSPRWNGLHQSRESLNGKEGGQTQDEQGRREENFKDVAIQEENDSRSVLEVEKIAAFHPEDATQATAFAAMMYNIARRQIKDWKRARTTIFKNAKGIKRNNTKAYKLRKGRFPACEAVVFEEFKDVRAKGKQVGPK